MATATRSVTAGWRQPEGRGAPLDTTTRIVTPERIVFEYPLAGPFRRVLSYFIDMVVLGLLVALASIVSLVLALGSASGIGLLLVAYFGLVWGYGAVFETFMNGQTPGKRAVGVRVVSDQGAPITGAQAVLRNLVGSVDGMLPFFYLPALASMLMTRKFQRLGALAAGTMVVVEERRRRTGMTRVSEAEVQTLLPSLPLRIAAGQDLARALSDYVAKRGRFGPIRREHMARPLAEPLRERYGVPANASSDAVLCAVYHRVFLGE